MAISSASQLHIKTIQFIAHKTWFATYSATHSGEQLEYMLQKYYSIEALQDDITKKEYFIFQNNAMCKGFMAIEHGYLNERVTKIHRLYVLPNFQGEGIGKEFIHFAEKEAKKKEVTFLQLNVNRKNKAQLFYEKMGFKIIETVDIPIGNGYLMEDFVLQKEL
jgi:diamine N-acetyltransferase